MLGFLPTLVWDKTTTKWGQKTRHFLLHLYDIEKEYFYKRTKDEQKKIAKTDVAMS